jgi:hypothetical protein
LKTPKKNPGYATAQSATKLEITYEKKEGRIEIHNILIIAVFITKNCTKNGVLCFISLSIVPWSDFWGKFY